MPLRLSTDSRSQNRDRSLSAVGRVNAVFHPAPDMMSTPCPFTHTHTHTLHDARTHARVQSSCHMHRMPALHSQHDASTSHRIESAGQNSVRRGHRPHPTPPNGVARLNAALPRKFAGFRASPWPLALRAVEGPGFRPRPALARRGPNLGRGQGHGLDHAIVNTTGLTPGLVPLRSGGGRGMVMVERWPVPGPQTKVIHWWTLTSM